MQILCKANHFHLIRPACKFLRKQNTKFYFVDPCAWLVLIKCSRIVYKSDSVSGVLDKRMMSINLLLPPHHRSQACDSSAADKSVVKFPHALWIDTTLEKKNSPGWNKSLGLSLLSGADECSRGSSVFWVGVACLLFLNNGQKKHKEHENNRWIKPGKLSHGSREVFFTDLSASERSASSWRRH